jgi:large subunit ribosomal protein L29
LEHPHRFKQARIKLAHLLTVQKELQRSTAS